MRHHTAADPGRVDAVAHRIDDSGDLAPRDRRELRLRQQAHLAAGPQLGVDEVHARDAHRDPRLPGGRLRVLDVLEPQVLGPPELPQDDRLHGSSRCESPNSCQR
jgi:hypothetical protein